MRPDGGKSAKPEAIGKHKRNYRERRQQKYEPSLQPGMAKRKRQNKQGNDAKIWTGTGKTGLKQIHPQCIKRNMRRAAMSELITIRIDEELRTGQKHGRRKTESDCSGNAKEKKRNEDAPGCRSFL